MAIRFFNRTGPKQKSIDVKTIPAGGLGNPSPNEFYTGDVTLAMSLVHSIASRHDELVSAWDSGRVDDAVLARIGVLLWGRLPDPLGAPSAFTLSEAGTLAAALVDRLVAELATDPLAGSGVAGRVAASDGGSRYLTNRHGRSAALNAPLSTMTSRSTCSPAA